MAGYTTAGYGYYKPPAPPRIRTPGFEGGSLAAAAAGGAVSPTNPFGLSAGPQNQGAAPGSAPPISYGTPVPATTGARQAPAAPPPGSVAGQSGNAPTIPAAASQAFDINSDPAFQAMQSLTGMGDEQAQAAALKGKRDTLLGYGDPNLVSSLLGDSTLAQAAGQNPTSTLAQLGQQRERNVHDLTEGLNKNNLLYSGYRVNQEQQAGQDYQNALAQAASAVSGNLGSIDSQLAAALGSNQQQRIQAMQAAYALHAQDVGAPAGAASTPASPDLAAAAAGGGDASAPAGGNIASTAIDPATGLPYGQKNLAYHGFLN